jgi:hypothetical protein
MYVVFILLLVNSLPLLIGGSLLPNREDWNVGTFSNVAKIVGGHSFEVPVHLTIHDGVVLKSFVCKLYFNN